MKGFFLSITNYRIKFTKTIYFTLKWPLAILKYTLKLWEFKMVISNIDYVPGKEIIEHYGLVQGSTIRAKHIGRDIAAGFKNILGGELKGYTELLHESRREAINRMVEQAKQMNANAIINVRFATSSVAAGAAELFAYGTAVKIND